MAVTTRTLTPRASAASAWACCFDASLSAFSTFTCALGKSFFIASMKKGLSWLSQRAVTFSGSRNTTRGDVSAECAGADAAKPAVRAKAVNIAGRRRVTRFIEKSSRMGANPFVFAQCRSQLRADEAESHHRLEMGYKRSV